jgi:mannose-1-phosphate guanylyltransferase
MHTVFLLAAGFGTRLRPLTNHRPKPLLPLMGRPMLDYALAHLKEAGHTSFLVNAHHLWEQIAEWATINGAEIQVELPEVLGTGGGLKVAQDKMALKFLIWNGDIISDIDPNALLDACPDNGAGMVLCYKDVLGKTPQLLFNDSGIITRIGNKCVPEGAPELPDGDNGWHFSGIHALSRSSLQHIPDGFQDVIKTVYQELIAQKQVGSTQHTSTWFDAGFPNEYLKANLDALNGRIPLSIDPWANAQDGFEGSWVHKSAVVRGSLTNTIIGADAVVAEGAVLDSCVVWDGVEVPAGEYFQCVFYDGGRLDVEM